MVQLRVGKAALFAGTGVGAEQTLELGGRRFQRRRRLMDAREWKMTRVQRPPAWCASLLIHAIPGEIHAEGMRLERRMVFPLVSCIDRHRIVQIQPGRTRLVSRFQMIGKVGIGRRRDRKRGDVDRMAGFLLLGGRDHPFPSFDDRLFHRYRSMNAVEFMVQACAENSVVERFKCQEETEKEKKRKKSIPHALQMVRPLSSRRHNGVMVVPQF